MIMKLQSLKIRNFMGCKELDIDFAGADMKIYGDNATGKTTIQNAFNWLLFDKNAGGKTDFGIKPYDASGEVIHRLETSVEGLFDIDGTAKLFKKVLTEKWTRQRGSAEDTYQGNEVSYYVNTIPKKKKEYTEEIANLIDENVFRMITNPLYFNENIDWKARRKMLLEICGDISDKDVIDTDKELEPLIEYLEGVTVEELKSSASSSMKSINKELGLLPSRIAEAEMAKPKPRDDVDVSALEGLEQQLREKVQAKSDILNGAEILRLKAELDNAKDKLARTDKFNFVPSIEPEFAEKAELSTKLHQLENSIFTMESTTLPLYDSKIKTNATRKKQLSEEWDTVFKETFLGTVCPTCKRELPPDQLEEKKREFNIKKAARLDAIEEELKAIKTSDNTLYYQKAEEQKELEAKKDELSVLKAKVENLNDILQQKHKDFYDVKEKTIKKINDEINDLRNAIVEQQLNAVELANGVDVQIADIESKIAPIKEYLAEVSMIERQEARIQELKTEQTKLSHEYTLLERKLYLCEKFVRRKVSMIDAKVNSLFRYARFKLFDVQVNGGIAETCEATYRGVPYRDLNTAGKINIGLDIINTLSTMYGVEAPIFVDNMESITCPIDTNAQRISLIVSEPDKTLRFEKED